MIFPEFTRNCDITAYFQFFKSIKKHQYEIIIGKYIQQKIGLDIINGSQDF